MWPFRSIDPRRRWSLLQIVLYQVAVVATGFAGWQVLSTPSTLAFFVFELGAALALGIFLAWRHNERGETRMPRHEPAAAFPDGRGLARMARPILERRGSWGETGTAPGRERAKPAATGARDPLGELVREGERLAAQARASGIDLDYFLARTRLAFLCAKAGENARAARILQRNNDTLRRDLARAMRATRVPSPAQARRVFLLSSTLFILLFATGVWLLSPALYVPPTTFYVVAGIAAAVVAASIYFNAERRSASLLAEIVLLGALVKFSFYYLNPYVYSSDVYLFFAGLQGVAATGFLPASLGYYQYFPALATFALAGVGVTGLPLTLYGIFAYGAEIATIPVVYLIGRAVVDRRVGLLAALLYVFTIYSFLPTWYTPSVFGLLFLFLAVYAAVRMRPGGGVRWFILFWFAALAALFSHPIDALILGLTLAIRFISFLTSKDPAAVRRAARTPAFSYAVVYGIYLAFVALTTFAIFVRSFIITEGGAPLATTPGVTLQTSSYYAIQTAIAPLGVTLPFFFVGYALFTSVGFSPAEHGFFRLLFFGFLAVPVLEVVSASYGLQSSRFLVYLSIPLVLLAAQGLSGLSRRIASPRRVVALLVATFLIVGFVAASSYLTQNDERTLSSAVPAVPTHITASALASRAFLELGENTSTVYMDFGSSRYLGNSVRSADSLDGFDTILLDSFEGNASGSFVLVNQDYLAYGSAYQGAFYDMGTVRALLQDSRAGCVFDAGAVQIYLNP